MLEKTTFAVMSLLTLIPALAEVAESSGVMEALKPLIQVGAVGAILAFFLIKLEPRLRAIEQAIYTLTRGNMLVIMNSENADRAIKHAAEEIKIEVESKLTK